MVDDPAIEEATRLIESALVLLDGARDASSAACHLQLALDTLREAPTASGDASRLIPPER